MIDFPLDKIIPMCADFGAELDSTRIKQLNDYGNILLEWNGKINLTAIKEPEEVVFKHFYDCILLTKHLPIKSGAAVIDVGTGAGFPGIVLKIMHPDIKLTLLDGTNKKLLFLNATLDALGLRALTLHARAEEAGRLAAHREKYDIATARAVAGLPVLLEYCLPFVKPGGLFAAMKGPGADDELKAAQNAARFLGADSGRIICETLPGNERRSFIILNKISQTPPKYPRISAKISKQPL